MDKIRFALAIILMFVFGIVLTVTGLSDIIKLNGYIPDFNYESMQDIKKGSFVGGYVANIYDCYANETTTKTTMGIKTSSKTSEEYFIMPLISEADLEKELYISVAASKAADRELLYQVCDDTWEYLEGNTDIAFTEMPVIAKVRELDPELKQYMVEWFMEAEIYGTDYAEIEKHIVPYEFKIYNPNSPYYSLVAGLLIIAAVTVIVVIFFKKRKSEASAEFNGYTNYSAPAPVQSAAAAQEMSGSFSESYVPLAPQPISDIPQPVQPDDFFAKPVRNPESKSAPKAEPKPEPKPEPKQTPAPEVPAAKPEPESVAAAPDVELAYAEDVSFESNMDGLDTTAVSVDHLGYFDAADEFTDDSDLFDFSNDGDYGDVDINSIEISD